MKISIALACFNGGLYLAQQLQSFVNQNRQPDELVVSDDASTDNTLTIVENFAATAPFPVIIHRNNLNLGYCGNFNQALLKTTGDLVFLSDQDDVWFPQKIQRIADFFEKNPKTLLVLNDVAITDSELNDTGLTKLGQLRSAGLAETRLAMGCCSAVRRDLLDFCLPIPEGFFAHDTWLSSIAEGIGYRVILSDVLQYYRRHTTNESQSFLNRTTRLTPFDNLLYHLKIHVSDLPKLRFSSEHLEQRANQSLTMLQAWAANAVAHAPDAYAMDVQRFLNDLDRQVQAHERRRAFRRHRLLTRCKEVISFWKSGGYCEFSGWKSALRDLLGR